MKHSSWRPGRIVTKIFYDTEFLENGKTIELISIGMVTEHGDSYYAVNATMPFGEILKHEWLMKNVVPSLPTVGNPLDIDFHLNFNHPSVKSRSLIATEVSKFVLQNVNPSLWAYYGAYDHVVLCQLFGRMIDLPRGFPMWTNDLMTLIRSLPDPPEQESVAHNALNDAYWNRDTYRWIHGLRRT